MAYKVTEQEIRQFREALASLRRQYSLANIAKRMGIDQANLSRYHSGIKKPGIATLEKFYHCFRKELEMSNNGYGEYEPMSPAISAESVATPYRHKDPGGQRTDEINRLNGIIDDLVTANRRMAKSVEAIAESNHQLVEITRSLLKKNATAAGIITDETDLQE